MGDAQEQIKAMEYATLKAPYEVVNKEYRKAHKVVEKECSVVQLSARSVEHLLGSNSVSKKAVCEALLALEKTLISSREKIAAAYKEESNAVVALKLRDDHLRIPVESTDPEAVEQWRRLRCVRYIAEYLLRIGLYNTAMKLLQHFDAVHLVNVDVFLTIRDVEETLEKHSTSSALAWCVENRSRLKKYRSNFEFNLRMQDFIEFIKAGKKKEALEYSKKHFRAVEPEQLPELQKLMVLLGFRDLNKLPAKYKPLLCETRWNELTAAFRFESFRLFQLQSASLFALVLQAGLAALKTPFCFSHNNADRSPLCPVCHRSFNKIAAQLPSSHHSQSKIRCRLTGEMINENNPPLALPNGQIYSYKGLSEVAAANNMNVVCPVTGEQFKMSQCEKVFLM